VKITIDSSEFTELARLAIERKPVDVEMWVARIAFRYQHRSPKFSKRLFALIPYNPKRG